jgi:hypothetical protein
MQDSAYTFPHAPIIFASKRKLIEGLCGGVRVHLAIRTLDAVTVLLALGLAEMLGRRFFYVGLLLSVSLSILRLHYGLQYSWTFVGKIAADFAVPLVMGWAGVHLAADVKAEREKKLWQAVFAMLAIFGLVVSFLVEVQLDEDHKREVNNLRINIKDDVTTAILRYNETNPQHPVTSEQFAELARSLSGKQNTVAAITPQAIILPLASRAEELCFEILEWAAEMDKLNNDRNSRDLVDKEWDQKFAGPLQGLYIEFAQRGITPSIATISIGGGAWLAIQIGRQLCGMAAQARQQAPHSNLEAHSQLINQAIIDRMKRFEVEGSVLDKRCSIGSQPSTSREEIIDWVNQVAAYVRSSTVNEHLKKEFDVAPIPRDRYANKAPSCADSLSMIFDELERIRSLEIILGKHAMQP